jgi:hypothetical protein
MKRCRGRSSEPFRVCHFEQSEEEQELKFPDPTEPLMHPIKNHRKFLKVQSVQRMPSEKKTFEEIRPLSSTEVAKMKDEDINVKLCDMGNACYITNHYSDII